MFRYEKLQRQDKEHIHAQLAVEAGRIQGILPEDDVKWNINEDDDTYITKGKDDVDEKLENWGKELEAFSHSINNNSLEFDSTDHTSNPSVTPISDLYKQIDENGHHASPSQQPLSNVTENLNEDQRRAYDIVDWHLQQTMAGKKPPQLLMMIPGEGGVGKSTLIRALTQDFVSRNVGHWSVKGAYTGIAASLIDGKTLHVLAGIPVRGGKQSAQTLKKLREFWRTKRYLIIDEISMLSRSFFAKMSQIISTAMETPKEEVFGGLNVILVGDFHQFPPVVARRSAPLYWTANPVQDSEDDIIGRKIYEQFTTVVQLNKQIRVQDPIWQDILQHVRYGNCRRQHIDFIKNLIVTNPNCPPTNYATSPWKDARLVTPRHAVRTLWNSAAIKKHCTEGGHRLYVSPAEDTIDNHPVSNEEKIAILTRTKGSSSQTDRAGLAKDVELAIGAPVMVTLNILTDLDVANGVRGTIEGIVLDERERQITSKDTQTIHLRYPPRYVLVKLLRTKAPCLRGLEENVIPIKPVTKTFTITKNGIKTTVNRTQLPLTLAYAFTDYRSQGQTLQPVIIDIGPPPHGYLTAFNIYVALSRGTDQQNIRLLRDFDESLLQQHPSEYLRIEDDRLKKLNEITMKIWSIRTKSIEKVCSLYPRIFRTILTSDYYRMESCNLVANDQPHLSPFSDS